ncbi:hypothetical protein LTR85_003831 [Meristemomyces frigidus]|nr:hypothetical protein LTR85_003831 [Meristemomyces frigidus]
MAAASGRLPGDADHAPQPPMAPQHMSIFAASKPEYWRTCDPCNVAFSAQRAHKRHLTSDTHRKAIGGPLARSFICLSCDNGFTREYDRRRHQDKGQCHVMRDASTEKLIPVKRPHSGTSSDEQSPAHKRQVQADRQYPAEQSMRMVPDRILQIANADPDANPDTELDAELVLQSLHVSSQAVADVGDEGFGPVPDIPQEAQAGADVEDWDWYLGGQARTDPLFLAAADYAHPNQYHPADDQYTVGGHETASDDGGSIASISSKHSLKDRFSEVVRGKVLLSDQRILSWKTKLNVAVPKCPICRQRYEFDTEKLRDHFRRHLQEYSDEHLCDACHIGFSHAKDLLHHQVCAMNGSCGFQFEHSRPCRGHHPPSGDGAGEVETDHFKLGYAIRGWETCQLDLAIAHARALQYLRSKKQKTSFTSLPEIRWVRRLSKSSLQYSLHSWLSEPYDVEPNKKLNMSDIVEELGKLTLDSRIGLIRHNAAKLGYMRRVTGIDDEKGLLCAARLGDLSVVKQLVQGGADVDRSGPDGTALMAAAANGRYHCARILLEAGAKVNAANSSGETALHKAIRFGHTEIVPLLLGHGAAVNLPDQHLQTVLYVSFALRDVRSLRLVLQKVDRKMLLRSRGPVLLHLAKEYGWNDVADLLLDFGVDPDAAVELVGHDTGLGMMIQEIEESPVALSERRLGTMSKLSD